MDIREFIAARLDEDEAVARTAFAGPWAVDTDDPNADEVTDETGQIVAYVRARPATGPTMHHIARHGPARVLAEVAAKRKLLAEIDAITIRVADGFPDDQAHERPAGRMLRTLATAYADHADYDPSWRVE